MQSNLTINIQCSYVADWNKTLDFLRKLNPVAVVACIDNMSNKGRIHEIQQALPNAQVIARCIIVVRDNGQEKELDGGMHLKPQAQGDTNKYIVSPDNFLNTWHELGENGLMLSYMNEPMVDKASEDDLVRQVNHILETIDKATKRNISLCVGNWGAGHYLTSIFDEVLRQLSKYRQHALGVHIYQPIDLTKALDVIIDRCRVLSITPPRIYITEAGFDAANGSDPLNGYKSRGYTGIQFATYETGLLNNTYKPYIMSGVLQAVAIFTWGGEASWHNDNVESDGWGDTILANAAKGLLSVGVPTPPPVTSQDMILVPRTVLKSMRDTLDQLLK